MKRPLTYRILAIAMAYMVFMSTSMASLSIHFCGDQIAGIGLFDTEQEAESCCEGEVSTCEQDVEDCCTDEYVDLDWDVDIAIQSQEIDERSVDIVAILPTIKELIINSPQATSNPQSYVPPLVQGDRIVLFQQFLC